MSLYSTISAIVEVPIVLLAVSFIVTLSPILKAVIAASDAE